MGKEHSELIRDAIQHLLIRGCPAWKNQTANFYPGGGRAFQSGIKGSADIIGCIPTLRYRRGVPRRVSGRLIAAEAKVGSDRLSEDQAVFRDTIEKAGGLYVVFRSVEELSEVLDEAGVPTHEVNDV